MTFSDAGAHVTQQECSLQTYLLAHWVRQKQEFTLEEAVRMVTLAPAEAWGFTDRGLLREGLAADINIFDPDRITPTLPVLLHDLPTGAPRLEFRAAGILDRKSVVEGRCVLVGVDVGGWRIIKHKDN